MKDVREVAERARARLGERGPGHDPLPRRGAPLQPRPTRRAAAVRRGGAPRPRRRDDREPVLLAHRSAALAQHVVPARTARRRRARRARRHARSRTTNAGSAPNRRRSTTTRSTHLVERSEGDARHLLTVLEVAHTLTVEDDRTDDHARRRRSRARDAQREVRRRRALRHRLRVHQVDPRLRSRRGPVLARRACSKRARTRASSRAGS